MELLLSYKDEDLEPSLIENKCTLTIISNTLSNRVLAPYKHICDLILTRDDSIYAIPNIRCNKRTQQYIFIAML